MDIEIIRRLSLARHLYGLGTSYLKSSNDLYLFSAVNLMQDAVEAFLLAVADHVGASVDDRTHFDKYFVAINGRIDSYELPFKNNLLRLNRIRVDSKHHGIQPAREECVRLSVSVREFFAEVSRAILKVNFSTVSTIDLLKKGEVKDLLLMAKGALEDKKYDECAISCRKALYLELECRYDIGIFREGAKPQGLLGPFSHAPYYTRNRKYIEENVKDPTDFVVIDHTHLDHELLKYGVDNTAYWNVWRLTPEVYRNEDKQWVVKIDFDKLDPDTLPDQIEYIFNATVDIIFSIHSKRASTRSHSYTMYNINLKNEEVPVYEKADKTSKMLSATPKGVIQLESDFNIQGLKGDGVYWHVSHISDESNFYGYIHGEHVK